MDDLTEVKFPEIKGVHRRYAELLVAENLGMVANDTVALGCLDEAAQGAPIHHGPRENAKAEVFKPIGAGHRTSGN